MPAEFTAADRSAVETIVTHLEAAWNAMDGDAFAAGHTAIFRSIYAGSANRYTLESARLVRPDVALAHVHAVLDSPQGPLQGRHEALFSLVLTRKPGGWDIAAFHNTLQAQQGPPR